MTPPPAIGRVRGRQVLPLPPTMIDSHDLDVSGLAGAFPTRLAAGRQALLQRLQDPQTDLPTLSERQAQLQTIRSRLKTISGAREHIESLRADMVAAEADCEAVGAAAADERHADYYNQLLWPADSFLSMLNERGWWNEVSLFFRSLFLPGTSVAMPLLVLAAPLVIGFLNPAAMGGGPMTVSRYLEIIQRALRQAMPSSLGKPRFAGRGGFAEMAEQFVHIGIAGAMFVASSWSQISSARSLRRVAGDMRTRAASVVKMNDAVRALGELLGVSVSCDHNWKQEEGTLATFGVAWNHPERVKALLEEAGRLDMLAAIALRGRLCFPTLDPTGSAGLELVDLFHPGLDSAARVYNTIRMGCPDVSDCSGSHVLLTGPNRGGKSTLLKALGGAILMSQTLGVVFARQARLPLFGAVVTALSPTDHLGSMSLFEAEIEFAKQVRATVQAATSPVFLMMDEIFHGTNAHDGVEASQVFLDELYGATTKAPIFSVVSTHYMELPRRYGDGRAQLLCMEASRDPVDEDRLIYSYRLCPGVNQYSSVREILRERGLLRR